MNNEYKKEWVDEAGFCNCLLVAMSRVALSEIEISSDHELPNLESIVSDRVDTIAWIRAQEIDYTNLNSEKVIQILMETSNISKLPWRKSKGIISVIDVVGDDGPEIERIFNLKLSKSNGVIKLNVQLNGA